MSRLAKALSGAVVLLTMLLAGPASGAEPCPDDSEVGYVCGLDDPEDLIRLPGTPHVITTGIGDTSSQRGGVYAVDIRTRVAREVEPDFSGRARPRYSACPGAPDPELFSAHGLALAGTRVVPGRRTTAMLYIVNHGGRESIEVFQVIAGAKRLSLRWTGCILTDGLAANSVAVLPGGDVVATVPLLSEAELFSAGLGQPTGDVLRWSEGEGWRSVPGAEISFPNGLLASRDGQRLYVAGYTEQAVVELALDGGGEPARRVSVPFNPDNLRWSPSGRILVAGQDEEPAVVQLSCIQTEQETCPIPTGVAELDPDSGEAAPLYSHPGDEKFGIGTAAILVEDEMWIGSARAKRVLRVPIGALEAPVDADAANGLPALRLTSRCLGGGRMWLAVSGATEQVEEVRFAAGRRQLGRVRRAPYARVLPRPVARRTAGRKLRAVVTALHGERLQVVLQRRARSCRA